MKDIFNMKGLLNKGLKFATIGLLGLFFWFPPFSSGFGGCWWGCSYGDYYPSYYTAYPPVYRYVPRYYEEYRYEYYNYNPYTGRTYYSCGIFRRWC